MNFENVASRTTCCAVVAGKPKAVVEIRVLGQDNLTSRAIADWDQYFSISYHNIDPQSQE